MSGILRPLGALLMLIASLVSASGWLAQIVIDIFVLAVSATLLITTLRRPSVRFRGFTLVLAMLAIVFAALNLISLHAS